MGASDKGLPAIGEPSVAGHPNPGQPSPPQPHPAGWGRTSLQTGLSQSAAHPRRGGLGHGSRVDLPSVNGERRAEPPCREGPRPRMTEKRCGKCEEVKPVDDFPIQRASRDGRTLVPRLPCAGQARLPATSSRAVKCCPPSRRDPRTDVPRLRPDLHAGPKESELLPAVVPRAQISRQSGRRAPLEVREIRGLKWEVASGDPEGGGEPAEAARRQRLARRTGRLNDQIMRSLERVGSLDCSGAVVWADRDQEGFSQGEHPAGLAGLNHSSCGRRPPCRPPRRWARRRF